MPDRSSADGAAAGVPFAGDDTRVRSERYRWVLTEWRRLMCLAAILAADWIGLALCLGLAWLLRGVLLERIFPDFSPLFPLSVYLSNLYFFAPWLVAFSASHLYTRRFLFGEEARAVVRATTAGAVLASMLIFAQHSGVRISRAVIGLLWVEGCVVLPFGRYLTKRVLTRASLWTKRVLLIGCNDTAQEICASVRGDTSLGYQPVAFVDRQPSSGRTLDGLPIVGPYDQLPAIIRALHVRDIVVALPDASRDELKAVVTACEGHVESIRIVSDTIGLTSVGVETEHAGGYLLLIMPWNLAKPWNAMAKRCFDIIGACALLVVAAPLLVCIALVVWADSGRPVFYIQERIGRHGRRFRCYKFRTMYDDASSRLASHLARTPGARDEWQRYAKLRSLDPRITRSGRWLRRFSLDELPQLINVLRDDMSLVGPRPYLLKELAESPDTARTILKAAPGLTGLWQVSGRNRLTLAQRLRLDEYYVRNWSAWLDLVILVRTGAAWLRGHGAY